MELLIERASGHEVSFRAASDLPGTLPNIEGMSGESSLALSSYFQATPGLPNDKLAYLSDMAVNPETTRGFIDALRGLREYEIWSNSSVVQPRLGELMKLFYSLGSRSGTIAVRQIDRFQQISNVQLSDSQYSEIGSAIVALVFDTYPIRDPHSVASAYHGKQKDSQGKPVWGESTLSCVDALLDRLERANQKVSATEFANFIHVLRERTMPTAHFGAKEPRKPDARERYESRGNGLQIGAIGNFECNSDQITVAGLQDFFDRVSALPLPLRQIRYDMGGTDSTVEQYMSYQTAVGQRLSLDEHNFLVRAIQHSAQLPYSDVDRASEVINDLQALTKLRKATGRAFSATEQEELYRMLDYRDGGRDLLIGIASKSENTETIVASHLPNIHEIQLTEGIHSKGAVDAYCSYVSALKISGLSDADIMGKCAVLAETMSSERSSHKASTTRGLDRVVRHRYAGPDLIGIITTHDRLSGFSFNVDDIKEFARVTLGIKRQSPGWGYPLEHLHNYELGSGAPLHGDRLHAMVPLLRVGNGNGFLSDIESLERKLSVRLDAQQLMQIAELFHPAPVSSLRLHLEDIRLAMRHIENANPSFEQKSFRSFCDELLEHRASLRQGGYDGEVLTEYANRIPAIFSPGGFGMQHLNHAFLLLGSERCRDREMVRALLDYAVNDPDEFLKVTSIR